LEILAANAASLIFPGSFPVTLSAASAVRAAGQPAFQQPEGLMISTVTVRGLTHFLAALGGYVVAFFATAAVPVWFAKIIGVLLIFFFLWRLAQIGHDAGHGSLTANPTLNRWLGRLAFLPSLVPFTTWVASHNALHHGFTNLRGKDPIWAPLSRAEFDALSWVRKALERSYRTFLGVCLYSIVELWWKNLIFPTPCIRERIQHRLAGVLDRLAVVGVFVVQVGGLMAWRQYLVQTHGLPPEPITLLIMANVVVPLLLMNWVIGMVGFLHHTHPRIRWYADLSEWYRCRHDVSLAVHVVTPWPVDWLLGNALNHTAHHVDPGLPFPDLPARQQQLEQACGEVIQRVRLADFRRLLATCKLYDYERHCWLDFQGNLTASP
jgi:omega-6 fatty acid desaturase (delta-12 desaturase)